MNEEALNITIDDEPAAAAPAPEVEVEAQEPAPEQPAPEAAEATPEAPVEEKKPVRFSDEQQEVMNAAIAKKVAKQREAERRAEELEARVADLQAKVPQNQKPEIPPMPNVWDDNYEDLVAKRDDAIRAAAAFDADNRVRQQQEQMAQQRAHQAEMEALQATVQTYSSRAQSMGIDENALAQAGQPLVNNGVSDDLSRYILEDESGPAITIKLAQDPMLLDEVRSASPFRAAEIIATRVKPQIAKEAKRTAPPPPTESLQGSGAKPAERGPKGATFE